LLQGSTLRVKVLLGSIVLPLSRLQFQIELVNFVLVLLKTNFGRRLTGLFLDLLRGNSGEFPFDLPAALLVPLQSLGQPEIFQLALMMALLERRSGNTQLGKTFVVLGE
jgi:hypothetical protein